MQKEPSSVAAWRAPPAPLMLLWWMDRRGISSCGVWGVSVGTCCYLVSLQITVFHISSEEHQDIDVAILRALLKGW